MISILTAPGGASRLVIWDEDYCDYVIKIALDEKYEKFCQHEVEVYEAAVKEGLADNFAWCMCYAEPTYADGKIDAPGIYVMEYMDCNEDEVSDAAWTYGYKQYCSANGLDSSNFDSADEYNDWNEGEHEGQILDYMESQMTSDYRRAFEVFMCKWWITDIHEQNVALRPDGSMAGSEIVSRAFGGKTGKDLITVTTSTSMQEGYTDVGYVADQVNGHPRFIEWWRGHTPNWIPTEQNKLETWDKNLSIRASFTYKAIWDLDTFKIF